VLGAQEHRWTRLTLRVLVSLAETRSFSRSAPLRHVTQPAFSRRIQSLEAWAGTDLVDRSSYPTRLTPAGETLYDQSMEVLQALQSTRAMLRGYTSAAQDVIEFAVPHTLAYTFFPAWVSSLRETFGFTGGLMDTTGGGGWGPIVTTSLVGAGNDPRTTIGSVNLAEFFLTVTVAASFLSILDQTVWVLVAGLAVGGLIAAPFAALMTRHLHAKVLLMLVGGLITCISIFNLSSTWVK
jgi:hypothetical protein